MSLDKEQIRKIKDTIGFKHGVVYTEFIKYSSPDYFGIPQNFHIGDDELSVLLYEDGKILLPLYPYEAYLCLETSELRANDRFLPVKVPHLDICHFIGTRGGNISSISRKVQALYIDQFPARHPELPINLITKPFFTDNHVPFELLKNGREVFSVQKIVGSKGEGFGLENKFHDSRDFLYNETYKKKDNWISINYFLGRNAAVDAAAMVGESENSVSFYQNVLDTTVSL